MPVGWNDISRVNDKRNDFVLRLFHRQSVLRARILYVQYTKNINSGKQYRHPSVL